MNNPIWPAPGPPKSITKDRFGDALQISPAGDGYVLFEIVPADPARQAVSVEIPAPYVVNLMGAAVESTGRSTHQLADMAVAMGLVRDNRPKPPPNRKARRATQKRGASFFRA